MNSPVYPLWRSAHSLLECRVFVDSLSERLHRVTLSSRNFIIGDFIFSDKHLHLAYFSTESLLMKYNFYAFCLTQHKHHSPVENREKRFEEKLVALIDSVDSRFRFNGVCLAYDCKLLQLKSIRSLCIWNLSADHSNSRPPPLNSLAMSHWQWLIAEQVKRIWGVCGVYEQSPDSGPESLVL